MPKVVYVGPCADGVEIADTGQWAAHGVGVDVPAELAARLVEQDVWEPAPTKKGSD